MLDCRLEGVRPTQLGVYDDKADGPVYNDSEPDEEDGAGDETSITKCVGLANNAGTSAIH